MSSADGLGRCFLLFKGFRRNECRILSPGTNPHVSPYKFGAWCKPFHICVTNEDDRHSLSDACKVQPDNIILRRIFLVAKNAN